MQVYPLVFRSTDPFFVEPEAEGCQQTDSSPWRIRPLSSFTNHTNSSGLSGQLLSVCRQIHLEASPVLYSQTSFNCSAREGVMLLMHTVGRANFSAIRHLILGWEQLQDFAWSLAKPDLVSATHSLETLELAAWRTRVRGGASFLWRDTRSYERQVCQAALDICVKHPRLRVVLERPYYRLRGPDNQSEGAWTGPQQPSTHRIKWRIVTDKAAEDMEEDETIVNLKRELIILNVSSSKDDTRWQPGSLSPF